MEPAERQIVESYSGVVQGNCILYVWHGTQKNKNSVAFVLTTDKNLIRSTRHVEEFVDNIRIQFIGHSSFTGESAIS